MPPSNAKKNLLYQVLMATDLFEDKGSYHYRRRLELKGSLGCYATFPTYIDFPKTLWDAAEPPDIIWEKDVGAIRMIIDFEDVFELCPKEVQEKLIWHLDLFK